MKRLFALCLLTFASFSLVAQTPKRGSVLLEEHTASNSATLAFTSWYSPKYDQYEIEFVSIVPVVDNVSINLNFSVDGGLTYDSSTIYDNSASYTYGTAVGNYGTVNQTALTPFGGDVGNLANWANHSTVRLNDPASANYKMCSVSTLEYNVSVANALMLTGYGIYRNTSAVNAFQVSTGNGNFSGTVRVYGLTH